MMNGHTCEVLCQLICQESWFNAIKTCFFNNVQLLQFGATKPK